MKHFKVSIEEEDLQKLRDGLADYIDSDYADEDIVQEMFFLQVYMDEVDVRNKVKVTSLNE